MANIPIVDLGENGIQFQNKIKNYNLKLLFIILKGDGSKIKEELDVAFSTIGFVYLKNHGVDQYLVYTSIVYT